MHENSQGSKNGNNRARHRHRGIGGVHVVRGGTRGDTWEASVAVEGRARVGGRLAGHGVNAGCNHFVLCQEAALVLQISARGNEAEREIAAALLDCLKRTVKLRVVMVVVPVLTHCVLAEVICRKFLSTCTAKGGMSCLAVVITLLVAKIQACAIALHRII